MRIQFVFSVALPTKKHHCNEHVRVRAPRGDVKIFDFGNRRSAREKPAAQFSIVKRSFTIAVEKQKAPFVPKEGTKGTCLFRFQYITVFSLCQCDLTPELLYFYERANFCYNAQKKAGFFVQKTPRPCGRGECKITFCRHCRQAWKCSK